MHGWLLAKVSRIQMLTENHAKEGLCRAGVSAIVAAARHNLSLKSEFDYGIDGTVQQLGNRGKRRLSTGVSFDFQLKASCNWSVDGSDIVYDLEAKSYNDLVESGRGRCSPFILILMCLPEVEIEWFAVNPKELVIRNAFYYIKLTGAFTSNSGTQRIRIPQANHLTPANLNKILDDIQTGVLLP